MKPIFSHMNHVLSAVVAALLACACSSAAVDDIEVSSENTTVTCPSGTYKWKEGSATVCGHPTLSTVRPLEPAVPQGGIGAPAGCMVAMSRNQVVGPPVYDCVPAPQYRSILKFFRFGIVKVGGVFLGEHSTTRVYRFKSEWDRVEKKYKPFVLDVEWRHANHWNPEDPRLSFYGLLESKVTDENGEGFKAYGLTAGRHCACSDDQGHATEKDSCYYRFPTISPFSDGHVCHSDTRVQMNAFLRATGRSAETDICGLGLIEKDAPPVPQ